ncbi:uncharacterized protein si:ch211-189a15.5 [Scomber scombrus]|uniref:uncharacterized protein si:ch211-189a15.5 n=1 Tax=Scomber scombrus TaxID=13677 RepID=UPI002DD7EAEC|nr:uncharacterized protein si:ch211-189a15.5 [Scomber scombrus]
METACVLVGETDMKDGMAAAGEPEEVSRQDLYEDYIKCYIQMCTEVGPCRDAQLLKKAAQYVLQEAEPTHTFTVFPFYQSVMEGAAALSSDYRKHLSDFIKATELLETLCINLFLQPWKKEIKTLKCFTGPFVYCLLPVLSSSTIQSVLASIGYLPHPETPQSEYKLSVDANPDKAMLVGFELLLARVECLHLLELVEKEKDHLGPQEWLELVQRRAGPVKTEGHTEKKTVEQMEDEKKKKNKEEANKSEVPLSFDTRPAVNSQPKSRSCHLSSVDQSIMEMQMTYDDLAIRGRPVLQDKPHRANSHKSSSKSVHAASTNNNSSDSKAVPPPDRDCIKSTKPAATTLSSKPDGSKVCEMIGKNSRSSGCNDGSGGGGGISTPANNTSSSFKNSDGSRVDDEDRSPQDITLHITLRAGSNAEQSLKPGESQPTAEPPAWTQQQAATDLQNKRTTKSRASLSDRHGRGAGALRELAERMGQLHVQQTQRGGEEKRDNKTGEENTNKERRKKGRKTSTEEGAEEQSFRKPVMETSPIQSHPASRCTRSFPSDPTVMKEQKQTSVCHSAPLSISTAD